MEIKKVLEFFKPSKQKYDSRMDEWFDKSDKECESIIIQIENEREIA